jgi:hypothetical protein
VWNEEAPTSSCFSGSHHLPARADGKKLLLIVRTPGCEPDAFRIQVTGADTVLICSVYNLKELKSKRQAPSRLTLKMRTIPPLFVFFICYEQLRDPRLLQFDPSTLHEKNKKCKGSVVIK